MGLFHTAEAAQQYASQLTAAQGEKWVAFKIHPNSLAAKRMGSTHAACRESERAEYAEYGAEFLDEVAA